MVSGAWTGSSATTILPRLVSIVTGTSSLAGTVAGGGAVACASAGAGQAANSAARRIRCFIAGAHSKGRMNIARRAFPFAIQPL